MVGQILVLLVRVTRVLNKNSLSVIISVKNTDFYEERENITTRPILKQARNFDAQLDRKYESKSWTDLFFARIL